MADIRALIGTFYYLALLLNAPNFDGGFDELRIPAR